jgi:hypothetical protein
MNMIKVGDLVTILICFIDNAQYKNIVVHLIYSINWNLYYFVSLNINFTVLDTKQLDIIKTNTDSPRINKLST